LFVKRMFAKLKTGIANFEHDQDTVVSLMQYTHFGEQSSFAQYPWDVAARSHHETILLTRLPRSTLTRHTGIALLALDDQRAIVSKRKSEHRRQPPDLGRIHLRFPSRRSARGAAIDIIAG
jgi:hypothetical protein